jgi:hypothetical protein
MFGLWKAFWRVRSSSTFATLEALNPQISPRQISDYGHRSNPVSLDISGWQINQLKMQAKSVEKSMGEVD